MRAGMDEYVAVCEKMARRYKCIFVDFQRMYEEFLQHRHSCCVAWDRVHPNEIGAMLMAKTVLDACEFDFYHSRK